MSYTVMLWRSLGRRPARAEALPPSFLASLAASSSAAALLQQEDGFVEGLGGSPLGQLGVGFGLPCQEGGAVLLQGAGGAIGFGGAADGGAQFHHGLVEVA